MGGMIVKIDVGAYRVVVRTASDFHAVIWLVPDLNFIWQQVLIDLLDDVLIDVPVVRDPLGSAGIRIPPRHVAYHQVQFDANALCEIKRLFLVLAGPVPGIRVGDAPWHSDTRPILRVASRRYKSGESEISNTDCHSGIQQFLGLAGIDGPRLAAEHLRMAGV